MLVLTRRIGERIIISDDIVITVLSQSDDGHARLGIDAPKEIAVNREEVYRRINDSKETEESAIAGQLSGVWIGLGVQRNHGSNYRLH